IAGSWLATQGNESRPPASDARNVAGVISGLVETDADPVELNPVLHGLANGNLRMTVGLSDTGRRGQPFQFGLSNVAYIVVLDSSGAVMASSDPSGANFAPPERNEWPAAATTATPNGSLRIRSGNGPAAFGSASILGQSGDRLATVIVAS